MYAGLFSAPNFQFPGKKTPPSDSQLATYGHLFNPGDLLTDTAVVKGTRYSVGHIVVTSVASTDVMTVGVILGMVIRQDRLLFKVSVHNAVRTLLNFFRACPCNEVALVDYEKLSDYKPLIKRDNHICFRFFLHHHLPSPLA
jgi:hypothetical protein